MIGFLDKGGVVKDGLGGRENQAFKTVRAKRDADEAGRHSLPSCSACRWVTIALLDKEYRKGVHWLETLRLRRTKILENGYKVNTKSIV